MTETIAPAGGMTRRDTAILCTGLASLSMGQAVILPVLGPAAREIGLHEVQIGAIVSIGALVAVVAAPWWGHRSDRHGRRGVFMAAVIAGLLALVATGAVLIAGQTAGLSAGVAFVLLLAVRILYAGVAAGGFPAASGFIADVTAPDLRAGAMALTGAAFGIGSLLGAAALFALAGSGGLGLPFLLAAAVAGAASIAAWRALREPAARASRPKAAPRPAKPGRSTWSMLLLATLAFTAASMIQQIVPFLIQDAGGLELDATLSRAGLLSFAMAFASLATLETVRRTSPDPRWMTRAGLAAALACAAAIAVSPSAGVLFVAHLGLGLGFGLLGPALQGLVSLRATAEGQAAAAGLLSAATTSGYIAGPVLGTALYGWSAPGAVIAAALLLAVALLLSARPGSP